MRILRIIGKIIAYPLLVMAITFWVLVFAIWMWPSILINTKNFERLAKYLHKHDIHISWSSVELDAHSQAFWKKRMSIKAEKLCISAKSYRADTCFDKVEIPVEFSIEDWTYKIRIGESDANGGTVILYEAPPSAGEKTVHRSGTMIPKLPAFLGKIEFSSFHVSIKKFRVESKENPMSGRLEILGKGDFEKSRWDIDGALNLPKKRTLEVSLGLEATRNQNAHFLSEVRYIEPDRKIPLQLKGYANLLGFSLEVNSPEIRLAKNLPSLRLNKCNLDLHRSSKDTNQVKLNCPVSLGGGGLSHIPSPLFRNLRNEIALVVGADLKIDKDDTTAGTVDIVADPVFTSVKEGRAILHSELKGPLSDFPNGWDSDSKVELSVKKFESLVQLLRPYPFAIPQPFASLSGSLEAKATGKGKLANLTTEFPLELQTRLKSQAQILDLDGNGKLSFTSLPKKLQTHLDFDLKLSNVRLELPNLAAQEPPQLFPDSRFKSAKQMVKTNGGTSSFTYNIRVSTNDGQPAHLVSNLAKTDVPIAINLTTQSEKDPIGSIRVMSFPANLFRRNATVRRLDMKLAENSAFSEINGEIQVNYTDYTIRILILGQLSEPQIRFASEPPLKDDQVLAVLLFGKTIDGLDSSQTQSISNTQAAMADSAVSLASMYLLAATPVESVGYDTLTGTFSAKVRLADGTSLNVGTDMKELSSVGIRRRLGSNFAVTTYLMNPLAPLQRTLTAYLEWNNRY